LLDRLDDLLEHPDQVPRGSVRVVAGRADQAFGRASKIGVGGSSEHVVCHASSRTLAESGDILSDLQSLQDVLLPRAVNGRVWSRLA
jgi:hypothetical protein